MPAQYRLMALRFYATVRKTAGNLKQSSPLSQPFVRYQTRGVLWRKSLFAGSRWKSPPLPSEA